MADFMTNLWDAVFTPGATPTLLIATNVTFGALQILLATLLLMTSSIHFAILSILCGSLWYAINWFAGELRAAQEKEEEAKRLRKNMSPRKIDTVRYADDEGDDTEVEEDSKKQAKELPDTISKPLASPPPTSSAAVTGQQSHPFAATRRKTRGDEDRSGDVSTDSEWEKVDGD